MRKVKRKQIISQKFIQNPKSVSVLKSSFFKRHSRLFSFFGAMIVFATFVVKEGVREELKADLDAIGTAETVYAIRQDNTRISGSRITIQWREINKNSAEHNPSQRIAKSNVEQKRDLLDETDDALNSSFSNLFGLERAARAFDARHIPNLSDEHKTQAKFKHDYNVMLAGDMTDDDYFQPSPTDEHDLKKFAQFENDSEFNLTRNDLIGTNIIELIEDKRESDERYYKIANICSYILYVICWGISLLGRMFGVEALLDE